ncbi:MAG: AMP-binding protein, partial [Rubrobacteraceae bacterium]|nr:AMP-binding protein [Rubrobacteraceae bacterium]
MNGLMMDYQLTLPAMMRRAEQLYPNKEIVTRLPDRSLHRYTYADFVSRAKKLAVALKKLGIQSGDRVATLSWNHHQHLEVYFGIPSA